MEKMITALKKAKNHVVLTLDNIDILCQPELIIKYHLSVGRAIDDETYQNFIHENNYLSCLRRALEKLKKMMTIEEMKFFLSESSYPVGVQKQVIHYLIEKKYLDDVSYAKAYMSLKKHSLGPSMIEYNLKQKGLKEGIINALWSSYDEYEILYPMIQSKLKQLMKKTKKQAFQSVKMNMLTKGFHLEVIDKVLVDLSDFVSFDEEKLLALSYQKVYQSYQKKLSGYELDYKIKEKLYQKGFSYDLIKAYMEKNKL